MWIEGKNISGDLCGGICGDIRNMPLLRRCPDVRVPCTPGAQRFFTGRLAFRRS